MNTKIKVAGNIISELSEKIPNNIIALNELVKNSYDAGASSVTIEINSEKGTFKIQDDGTGMNRDDINTLFHLSKSNKIHGRINEFGRITQGSKGLGFLSVFKFGKYVEWETKKDKGYKFSVDYNALISSEDISNYEIELEEDNYLMKGTKIIISLDEYAIKSLKKYFLSEKNYKKTAYSFNDANFEINLKIDNLEFSNNKKILAWENEKKYQLYRVVYSSDDQKIVFFHNTHKIMTESFVFDSKEYKIDIDLIVFQLKPHGKEKIDKLFYNNNDDLTPLVYYNSNLFNNYNIFDPNIMKNIKTDLVLNQIIGYINIFSENQKIDFNSDRSQFLQNEATDSIVNFLAKINRFIQEKGSEKKKYLMDFNILWTSTIPDEYNMNTDIKEYKKLIQEDFAFKEKVKIDIKNNEVIYRLFGKSIVITKEKTKKSSQANDTKTTRIIPAKINLNCTSEINIDIPSAQIDLLNYIASVYDSKGEEINKSELRIKIDKKNKNHILPSIKKPCSKIIEYSYKDSNTGIQIKTMKLNFIEPVSNITFSGKAHHLIAIPSQKSYKINYNSELDNLIKEINSLPISKYKGVISCSLRTIFEFSVDSINKSTKFSNLYNTTDKLANRVKKTIEYIKKNNSFMSEIANSTKISYQTLKNLLQPTDFENAVNKSHLSVHQSSGPILIDDIKYTAKYVSLFIIITNEMLTNGKIK